MNRTKYARHRSIKKGKKNQLTEVLRELKGKAKYYKEYETQQDDSLDARQDLDEEWGAANYCLAPSAFGSIPEYKGVCRKFKIEKVPEPLRSGVQRIWPEVAWIITTGFRGSIANGLIVIAHTNDFFDIIVSKWGRGDD